MKKIDVPYLLLFSAWDYLPVVDLIKVQIIIYKREILTLPSLKQVNFSP